jgi:hypothetical protein
VAHPAPVRGGGRPGGPNLIVGYAHGDAVLAVGDDRAAGDSARAARCRSLLRARGRRAEAS